MPPINQRNSRFGRRSRENEITFDPGDFKPVTPYSEDLKEEYQEAQLALHDLRQREEQIRRKAEQLEEITQKEDDFNEGRDELVSQIEGYLDLLDREASESEKISEQCASTHQRFLHHLHTLEKLNPDSTDRQHLNRELDMALRQIEAAEIDIEKALPLINHISGDQPAPPPARKELTEQTNQSIPLDFSFWLKAGFAFTLPLMMLLIALAIALFFLN